MQKFFGENVAPMGVFANWVLITHEKRGTNLVAEGCEIAVWVAAKNETDVARGEAEGGAGQAVLHEGIVAQVGVG